MSAYRRRLMSGSGGGLNPTEYIKFADPEVERICIETWSTDGIGVTNKDIQAVSYIPTEVFSNNPKIKTFDEFELFVNVTRFFGFKEQIKNCINLESISFPPKLDTLGEGTFSGNTKMQVKKGLENIKLLKYGGNFKNTGLSGVLNMPKLTGVMQADSFRNTRISEIKSLGEVTYLKGDAFHDCNLLKKVRLPSTLTNISWYVFANTIIETLILESTTPTKVDEWNSFSGVDKTKWTIYVPDESVELYKAAPYWSTYADKIKPLSTYVEL